MFAVPPFFHLRQAHCLPILPGMHRKRHRIEEQELRGFKCLQALSGLRESLHNVGCERDRAGNRLLHMDQYIALLLLYLFNPICTSLRSLQQASARRKVQKKLGVPRASLGSLFEAATVFDSQRMVAVIDELGRQLPPISVPAQVRDLAGILTAVDGTLLKALPKITWVLWIDEQHKAVKNQVHFEIRKGVPVAATLTDAHGNEKDVLAARLSAARFAAAPLLASPNSG